MTQSLVLGVWGALTCLSFVTAAVSLYLVLRTGSLHELQSQLRSLQGDSAELFDLLEKWTKRDRVRRLRESRELPEQPQLPLPGSKEYKSYLRSKLTVAK